MSARQQPPKVALDPHLTLGQMAILKEEGLVNYDIGRATLSRARWVLREGTPEEIEAVKNGTRTVSEVSNVIKSRIMSGGRYDSLREKVNLDKKDRRELEKRLTEEARKLDGIARELDFITSILADTVIDPEHPKADMDKWLASLTASRRRISRLINRMREI